MKRYIYEEAEKILDAHALSCKGRGEHQFYRAYRKLKCILAVYAYMDFPSETDPQQRVAWAWEDLDIAFRGYSENILTGAVLQLWDHTKKKDRNRFHEVITSALMAANEATHQDVPRRYLPQWRDAEVRKGTNDFDLHIALPTWGPKLRDWAVEEGFDALEIEEQFKYLEEAERGLQHVPEPEPIPVPNNVLQLLPGGKDG